MAEDLVLFFSFSSSLSFLGEHEALNIKKLEGECLVHFSFWRNKFKMDNSFHIKRADQHGCDLNFDIHTFFSFR